MKRIYIVIFAAALLTAACTRENAMDSPEKGDLTIRVSLDGLVTKTAGVGAENTVDRLDFLVFNESGTQLYKQRVNAPTLESEGYYELSGVSVSAVGGSSALATNKVLVIANYPGDFGSESLSEVQALTLEADNGATNAASLGKFIYRTEGTTFENGRASVLDTPSFVMTTDVGSFKSSGDAVVSSLDLKRLAAKVAVAVEYPEQPTDPSSTTPPITTDNGDGTHTAWSPMTGANVRVYLDNGAREVSLGGPVANPAYFRYADSHPYTNTFDFYTYPIDWTTTGSGRAPFVKIIQPWRYVRYDDSGSSTVILEENVVELYYKVVFPGLTALESNTLYNVSVKLDVLGGEAENPVPLTATGLTILGWGTVNDAEAGGMEPIEITDAKYMIPMTHSITTENGEGVTIDFKASGDITVTVQEIYKEVYTNNGTATKYLFNSDPSYAPNYKTDDAKLKDSFSGISTASGHVGEVLTPYSSTDKYWFEIEQPDPSSHEGKIILRHELVSTFGANEFAARPYTYKLNLHLNDANDVPDQTVVITQYPPIVVEGKKSTGWVVVNNNTADFGGIYRAHNSSDAAISNVYPETRRKGTNGSSSATTYVGYINTYMYLNPDNSNTCRYLLIVSVAPKSGLYILDPRIDLSSIVYATDQYDACNGLYGIMHMHYDGSVDKWKARQYGSPLLADNTDQEKILKYRPTIKAHNNGYIAPEFMVNSSYGRNNTMNYREAVLRCAAYQEDGYPAGRWRLPTEEEIKYCMDLQSAGAIPEVFSSSGTGYWASSAWYYANGEWTDNTGNLGNNVAYTRCVYDTWYWGREEVGALKDGFYEEGGTQYQKYKWSGWGYTSKN